MAFERPAMGRRHRLDVQSLQRVERPHVVAERVALVEPMHANVGRDLGQDRVSREQHALFRAVEAQQRGRVPGGKDCP